MEASLGYAENLVLKYKIKGAGRSRGVFTRLLSDFHPSRGKASVLGLPEDIVVAPRRALLLLLPVFRGQ